MRIPLQNICTPFWFFKCNDVALYIKKQNFDDINKITTKNPETFSPNWHGQLIFYKVLLLSMHIQINIKSEVLFAKLSRQNSWGAIHKSCKPSRQHSSLFFFTTMYFLTIINRNATKLLFGVCFTSHPSGKNAIKIKRTWGAFMTPKSRG